MGASVHELCVESFAALQAAKGGLDKQTVITVAVVIVVLAVMLVCSFIPILRLPMVSQCTPHRWARLALLGLFGKYVKS